MKKMLFINCCIREDSRTERLCRAYLAQLGGEYELTELCAILGMEKPRFYCAQGLDIHPDRVEEILAGTVERMREDARRK